MEFPVPNEQEQKELLQSIKVGDWVVWGQGGEERIESCVLGLCPSLEGFVVEDEKGRGGCSWIHVSWIYSFERIFKPRAVSEAEKSTCKNEAT